MDFKKLFMNNKAVSPVIGVILMVAITVILAAAIGSAVFGQGTAQSAPQANLDVQSGGLSSDTIALASIKIEHLGGDLINFATTSTKIMVSIDGGTSKQVLGTSQAALGIVSVGDVKTLALTDVATNTILIASGNTVNIKIIDLATNQLICDKNVRF
jgi:flagellin-like protein